jgi:PPOX class probable F420-dependent enzyme
MGTGLSEELKAVIDGDNFAHLTTVDPDGAPQASAMWIMRDEDQIVFNTAEGRRKWRNMNRDPRVAVSISPADKPYHNWSIQGRVVEMRTSDGVEVIDRLARKYLGTETYPYLTPGMVRVTVIVEVARVAENARRVRR